MRAIFITVILTFVIFKALGQVDSTGKQILNYDDSKSVIISKGRNLLLDKFLENDFEKVKEVKDYLIEKAEDENYFAFYPVEYWLILYWTNEYEELLNSISTFDSTTIASYHTRIRPSQDMLSAKLRLKSNENVTKIIMQIQFSDIEIEKKKILQLNFENLTNDDSYQDTLNNQADTFLKTYPESLYKDFVKNTLDTSWFLKIGGWLLSFLLDTAYTLVL